MGEAVLVEIAQVATHVTAIMIVNVTTFVINVTEEIQIMVGVTVVTVVTALVIVTVVGAVVPVVTVVQVTVMLIVTVVAAVIHQVAVDLVTNVTVVTEVAVALLFHKQEVILQIQTVILPKIIMMLFNL